MRTCVAILAATLAACMAPAATNTPAARLEAQIPQAVQADNAAGARGLCAILWQALQKAESEKKNINARREWEDVVIECQDGVGGFKTPEAQKVFLGFLDKMLPAAQTVLLLGFRDWAPAPETGAACLKLLTETRDFQVKIACLALLRAHPFAQGLDAVAGCLRQGEPLGLQIAACRTLAFSQDKAAIALLISFLRLQKSGRLRHEATAALRLLTGKPFIADAGVWDNWWSQHSAGFVAPPPVLTEFNYELQADPKQDLSYYEIPIVEERIIFIIDTSGSMQYGGKPCRLDKARDELKTLIGRLNDRIFFNIILYSGNVRRWQKLPLVQATLENRKAAQQFLDAARPGGSTMTMAALEEALWEIAVQQSVETIFLLTDGAPTPMYHSGITKDEQLPDGMEAIRRRIRFINQTLNVRINTIGVYTRDKIKDPDEKEIVRKAMKDFLENVAADNDGVYREVK
jgi:hypothetical protein